MSDIASPMQYEEVPETCPVLCEDGVAPSTTSTVTQRATTRGARRYPALERRFRTKVIVNIALRTHDTDKPTTVDAL